MVVTSEALIEIEFVLAQRLHSAYSTLSWYVQNKDTSF